MSELTRRILFALVGAPLTIGLIYAGGWIFTAALGAVAGIRAWELFRMARNGGSDPLEIGLLRIRVKTGSDDKRADTMVRFELRTTRGVQAVTIAQRKSDVSKNAFQVSGEKAATTV